MTSAAESRFTIMPVLCRYRSLAGSLWESRFKICDAYAGHCAALPPCIATLFQRFDIVRAAGMIPAYILCEALLLLLLL